MKVFKLVKFHWPIALILILAAVLRFWRLEELTTFGGDQGYDFLIVKRMIVDGDFTLLGPKIGPYNEIGNLYLGPAYYYLLAPFLLLFSFDPIGPAVLTVVLSLATILLIYLIGIKFFTKPIAFLTASFYSFNAFLTDQSRAPSNPHLIPFFAALATYCILEIVIKKSKSIAWPLICGFSLGIMFQLHYLTVSFAVSVVLIFLTARNLKDILLVSMAFIAAISPQIIFEARHNLFITNIFLKQISSGQNLSTSAIFNEQLERSTQSIFMSFTNTANFLYLLIPIALISLFLYTGKNKKSLSLITFLILTVAFGLISASIYSGELGPHYFASFYVSFTLLLAISAISLFSHFTNFALRTIIIIALFQIFAGNILNLNLNRQEGFTMPTGWNLKGIKTASEIIASDVPGEKTFNIASTLNGDTRARPYRYLVETKGKIPLGVEHYPEAEILYLISRDDRVTIKSYTVWEVASFAPFEFESEWEIQNNIKLYKLAKN